MALGTCGLLHVESPPPPPAPPRPPSIEQSEVAEHRYRESFYRALVLDDARRAGLVDFDADSLRPPNRHVVEFTGERGLRAGGGALQTDHLRISVATRVDWARSHEQAFRSSHLTLRIENRTDVPLAYLVRTEIREKSRCASKGVLPHNAVAVLAHETIERTECLGREGDEVLVKRVEVLEVTALGHAYVSRLLPTQIGLEGRTSEGHEPPRDRPCGHVPVQEFEGPSGRLARWAEVMDFYSRHNCDEYYFSNDYRLRTEPLPVLVPFHATRGAGG